MAINDNNVKWEVKKVAIGKTPTMIGATSIADGKGGLVPSPSVSDVDKFLCGDGSFKEAGKVKSVNGKTGDVVVDVPVESVNGKTGDVVLYQYSTTDLTAGSSALTNGQLYLVYE